MTRSRFMLRPRWFFALTLFSSLVLFAQAPTPGSTETKDTKMDGIVKETQKQAGGKNVAGLVWWVPAEFWEASAVQQGSSLQQARETFGSLREYTAAIVLAGKIAIGNLNLYSENELRSNASWHDADGQIYKPLTDDSSDAACVISIIKPVMANILAPGGQKPFLFFPSKTRSGVRIADPTYEGRFAISNRKFAGNEATQFRMAAAPYQSEAGKILPCRKRTCRGQLEILPVGWRQTSGQYPSSHSTGRTEAEAK
jgi:hypothetical protein